MTETQNPKPKHDLGKRKLWIAITSVAVIIIIAVIALVLSEKDTGKEKKDADETVKTTQEKNSDIPAHNCAVGTFTKTIKRGEETIFEVMLEKSRFWPKYRVSLGNLPQGVYGEIDEPEGRGDGRATIRLKVTSDARPANYSLGILYEEEKADGGFSVNNCQYNLVVK